MKRENIEKIHQLSPMQEGMLFHYLKEPNAGFYHEIAQFAIEGEVNGELLEKSWNMIIEKHDIFRSLIVHEKVKKPVQVVMKEKREKIIERDISFSQNKEMEIEEIKNSLKREGFDFQKGMLSKLVLIKTDVREYTLLWNFHHIIIDGWSIALVIKELTNIYKELLENQNISNTKGGQYAEYIKWIEKQDINAAETYWAEYLHGYDKRAEIEGAKTKEHSEGEYSFHIDKENENRLKEISVYRKITMNSIIQTVIGKLIMEWSNSSDVVFGTVVSGRPYDIHDVGNIAGLFINTIPIRINSRESTTFYEAAKKIQEDIYTAERFSYFPLTKINSMPDTEGQVINHIVAYENYPVEGGFEGMGIPNVFKIKKAGIREKISYNLAFQILPEKNMQIKLMYNKNGYSEEMVKRIAGQINTIIKQAAENIDIRLDNLDIMDEIEKNKVLYEFNNTNWEYPQDKTIHELFEEQAERTPDNTAVVFGDVEVTYRELNERANVLAHRMRECGIKPDGIAAIMMERSIEMITAIIAVLKAGGAYLPIDPEYPHDRIVYMLEDSKAGVLITDKGIEEKYEGYRGTVIFPSEYRESREIVNLAKTAESSNLAYVIYTSGSTGKPKGVMIEHRGLVNLCEWYRITYKMDEKSKVLLMISYAFDASVKNIMTPLICGGELVLANAGYFDSLQIHYIIKKRKITLVNCVPGAFYSIIDLAKNDNFQSLNSLKYILFGGEGTNLLKLKELLGTLSKTLYIGNIYGPTECTDITTSYLYNTEIETIPIGKPVNNYKVYILNGEKVAPIGISGELCIAGDGLARGYLNNENLTAEKFVDNPFEPGKKMYRTGDLARWMPDGNIEYLGRIDHQVKIRGYRIELGEIESRMSETEGVRNVVVIDRSDSNGNKYLCAYYTGSEIDEKMLRAELHEKLPDYMVPAKYVYMDDIPLTPNGKVDRKKLPEPKHERRGESAAEYENDAERKLSEVWKRVLGVSEILPDDDFFMLGGDSLKVIQCVVEMQNEYEIKISDIFDWKTLRMVAKNIKYTKGNLDTKINKCIEVINNFDAEIDGLKKNNAAKYGEYRKWMSSKYNTPSKRKITGTILIAGGTGYLGSYILRECLEKTDNKIVLIVRGKESADVWRRYSDKEMYYHGKRLEDYRDRITIFAGDMAKPMFGLNVDQYTKLADETSLVINAAANVRHYGHYEESYNANVKSVEEIIKFCNKGNSELCHISTTSVMLGEMEGTMLFTENLLDAGQKSENVYIKTKFDAEKLIEKEVAKGLKAAIIRVGNLMFDSVNGRFQTNIEENNFYLFIKGLINSGVLPDIKTKVVEISPVDITAEGVLNVMLWRGEEYGVYHVYNPNCLNFEELGEMLRYAGCGVETVTGDVFGSKIKQGYDNGGNKGEIDRIMSNVAHLCRDRETVCDATEKLLSASGFRWKKIENGDIKKMVDHMRERKFL